MRINISGEPRPFQESITVPEGADIAIECFGSGDLQWTASNGLEIPGIRDAEPESSNIYQVYISSRDAQLLQIRNFSRSRTAAGYTCRTDLTIQRGARVEITVTLHGGIYDIVCLMHDLMVPQVSHLATCAAIHVQICKPDLKNAFMWRRVWYSSPSK